MFVLKMKKRAAKHAAGDTSADDDDA